MDFFHYSIHSFLEWTTSCYSRRPWLLYTVRQGNATAAWKSTPVPEPKKFHLSVLLSHCCCFTAEYAIGSFFLYLTVNTYLFIVSWLRGTSSADTLMCLHSMRNKRNVTLKAVLYSRSFPLETQLDCCWCIPAVTQCIALSQVIFYVRPIQTCGATSACRHYPLPVPDHCAVLCSLPITFYNYAFGLWT